MMFVLGNILIRTNGESIQTLRRRGLRRNNLRRRKTVNRKDLGHRKYDRVKSPGAYRGIDSIGVGDAGCGG